MIRFGLKRFYYSALDLPMRLNAIIHRRFRASRTGPVKVHLGPGQQNYLDGWVNVDANMFSARIDLWANILHGLPFPDGTVDAIYSHHVIEHLPDNALPDHFREMYRCLKPGGVFRVGGPNGESAARKFIEGDTDWFSDFPDRHASIGGRFANFILCRGEHLTILTESYLREIATPAGFVDFTARRAGQETGYPEFFDTAVLAKEDQATNDLPHTLIIEARKPGGETERRS